VTDRVVIVVYHSKAVLVAVFVVDLQLRVGVLFAPRSLAVKIHTGSNEVVEKHFLIFREIRDEWKVACVLVVSPPRTANEFLLDGIDFFGVVQLDHVEFDVIIIYRIKKFNFIKKSTKNGRKMKISTTKYKIKKSKYIFISNMYIIKKN